VLVIAVLALAVRLLVFATDPGFKPVADSLTYDRMATSLAETGSLPHSAIPPFESATAYPPPLFPVVLAGAYKVVGTGSLQTRWDAARVLEALLGTVTVILICLITARLFDRKVALLAGAIAVVYPPLVLIGTSIMTESLFIPLMLAAVLTALIHRESRHRLRWAIATGVLIGLVALNRGNGITLIIPLGFLLWSQRPRWTSAALRSPIVMVLATLVTLTPWAIRNISAFHEFVPITTETGYALAGTYNAVAAADPHHPTLWVPPVVQIDAALAQHPHLSEAQLSDQLQTDAIYYIRHHPLYPLKVMAWSAIRLFNLTGPGFETWSTPWEGYPAYLTYASVLAFWLAAILAVVAMFRGVFRRTPWAVWGSPLVILLSALPFAGLTRYRSPADPFFVILAAVGLIALARQVRGRRLPSAPA
jgi:4-amino-4-deoxy-L-arabinose transferase-like glycosyltransferase